MKNLFFYFLILVLVGCTTQRKVTAYLDDKPLFASKYCHENFKPTVGEGSADSTSYLEWWNKFIIKFKETLSIKDSTMVDYDTTDIKVINNDDSCRYAVDMLLKERTGLISNISALKQKTELLKSELFYVAQNPPPPIRVRDTLIDNSGITACELNFADYSNKSIKTINKLNGKVKFWQGAAIALFIIALVLGYLLGRKFK